MGSTYTASVPPETENFLKRPQITKLLKNAFKKPLTTVIASAGYGKTQAVLAALKSFKCKPVWIQLSELDNYIDRFWEHIIHAFFPYSPNLTQEEPSLSYPESDIVFDRFLRLLAKDLTPEEHYILVLDDFHLISNKTILKYLELFLSTRIQNFSVVIISRKIPDLNLPDLLSKELLARITEDDLRFSQDETDAYFRKQGINLNEKLLSNIYSYTDGWIFAIYLVGLAVKRGDISNQNPILAVKIDILNLIEQEIFAAASKSLQDFLIKISVLDVIPFGLLRELAQNNTSLIKEMMRISLLIRYDSFSDSYRIHHLFREFLMEKKGRLTEDAIKEIHLTAARWYEKNNHKIEALDHYKQCNLYNEIFDIVLSMTCRSPRITDFFIELFEQAPAEILKARPLIRVARAKYIAYSNRVEEARQELLNMRKEFEALPKTKENQTILGEVYLGLALVNLVLIDYEFVELFKMADKCLPDGTKLLLDNRNALSEGMNVCSIKDPSAGELIRHQDALFDAVPYASRVMNGYGYGIDYLNAAESSLYTADLKNTEKYAYEAIYRSRQYQQDATEFMANFSLVRVFTAKGNYTKVADILDQMKNQLEDLQNLHCTLLYDIILGWVYVKIGQTDKVAKWIMDEKETRKIFVPIYLGREYLVRSDCLLMENRYYELLALMEQTDRMYEAKGILFARIQNHITKAIIHHDMDNPRESMDMLHKAYELSHANNLVMQYIEYGKKMRNLIQAARLDKSCRIPQEWLNTMYTKSSTYAKQLKHFVSEYNTAHALTDENQINLSKRESEVLTYLCRGLTRDEIAASCYLSLSTVNGILQRIYNKLGAANAVDAIRIAKEKYSL